MHDRNVRQGSQIQFGPVLDRVGTEIMRTVAEAGVALRVPQGSVGEASALRAFIERGMHRLRRVAAKLGCRAQEVDIVPAHHQASTSRSRRSSAAARSSSAARSSAAAGSSSRARTFSSDDENPTADGSGDNGGDGDPSESDDDRSDPEYNEISMSQLQDAPRPSQPSQRARRGPIADLSPSNIVSGRREKRPRNAMTPGTDALAKGKGKGKGKAKGG
ncbi:unnamed protein product [Urochloa humidicola]